MRRIRFLPLVIAIFAIIAPGFVTYANANALTNGSFVADGGGWSGANGGNGCSSGSPSIGGWAANRLALSYVQETVSQSVIVQQPSTLNLSISAHFPWGGQYSISIQDDDQNVSTGLLNVSDWNSPSVSHSLSVTTSQPSEVVTVSISGRDNMFWAGCYGPQFSNAELIASPTTPATTTTTIPENLVWIELNEGWGGEITAPSGVFSSVLFASYGNPEGSNGSYTLGWCHAQNSLSIIEELVIGNSSAVLNASNGVFGDPCGGTYKRLYVAAVYAPVATTTTSTTSTTTTSTSTTTTTTTIPETTTTEETTTTTTATTTTTELIEETTTTTDAPPAGTTIEETTTTTENIVEETTSIPENTVDAETDTVEKTTTEPKEQSGGEDIQDTETTVSEPAPESENEAPQDANNEVVEVTAENLDEVLSEEVTPEVVDAVVDAITSGDIEITAEVASKLVDVLTSGEATDEQIIAVVAALIEAGQIDSDVATELATSPEVLQAVSGEEASGIFSAVEVSELTNELAAELVDAVQDAPKEVRQAFEAEINVFEGSFDTYTPIGSKVDVGTRRVVVAASAAMFAAPAPSASSSTSDSGRSRRRS